MVLHSRPLREVLRVGIWIWTTPLPTTTEARAKRNTAVKVMTIGWR
jgi:hypothetical protein